MNCHCSRSVIPFDYKQSELSIQQVSQVLDLGILFVSSLNFGSHIDYMTGKPIIRHLINFSLPNYFLALCNALVRLVLKCGSIMWSPYTFSDIYWIDRVLTVLLASLVFTLTYLTQNTIKAY